MPSLITNSIMAILSCCVPCCMVNICRLLIFVYTRQTDYSFTLDKDRLLNKQHNSVSKLNVLTLTTFRANSSEDKLVIFFFFLLLIFPGKHDWTFYEMTNPVFWEKKKMRKNIANLSSAEFAYRAVKNNALVF